MTNVVVATVPLQSEETPLEGWGEGLVVATVFLVLILVAVIVGIVLVIRLGPRHPRQTASVVLLVLGFLVLVGSAVSVTTAHRSYERDRRAYPAELAGYEAAEQDYRQCLAQNSVPCFMFRTRPSVPTEPPAAPYVVLTLLGVAMLGIGTVLGVQVLRARGEHHTTTRNGRDSNPRAL